MLRSWHNYTFTRLRKLVQQFFSFGCFLLFDLCWSYNFFFCLNISKMKLKKKLHKINILLGIGARIWETLFQTFELFYHGRTYQVHYISKSRWCLVLDSAYSHPRYPCGDPRSGSVSWTRTGMSFVSRIIWVGSSVFFAITWRPAMLNFRRLPL